MERLWVAVVLAGCGTDPAFEYTSVELQAPSVNTCVLTFEVIGESFSTLEIDCVGEACTCTLDGEVATFFTDLAFCSLAGEQLDADPDALSVTALEGCGGADLLPTG